MKEIIGKKLGMTRVFVESGESVPCTVIQAGPCPVVAKKTREKHGYDAYQVGFGPRKKTHTTKPMAGHFAKAGVEPTHYLREIRFDESELEIGGQLTVSAFTQGERVDISGTSRGLGFQGGMKRHHFNGANVTHGQSDRWRAPGSIGSSSYPSRVYKGQRMAGRMGRDKVTVANLEVVKIFDSEHLMLVKGAVPGHRGALLRIRKSNRGR